MFKRILIAVTLFCIGSANAQLVQNGAAPEKAISKGAEIAGQTLKGMLSPNSMETNAVEKEREYR